MNNQNIRFTQAYSITSPKEETTYPITVRNWEKIKKDVDNIEKRHNYLITLSSTFFGIAITFLVGALTLPTEPTLYICKIPSDSFCWISFFLSISLSVIALIAGVILRKNMNTSKNNVIDFMKHIEEGYIKDNN